MSLYNICYLFPEAQILWPSNAKSWLIGKDSDGGKDWEHEEKGATGDEIFGWYDRFNGHEFEQTLGDGEGQGKPGVLQSMGLQRVRHEGLNYNNKDVLEWYSTI